MRTTRKELDSLVEIVAHRLGRPEYRWERVQRWDARRPVDGGQQWRTENVCTVGALTLDHSYGGYRLHEVISEGGGVTERSRLPMGQMADYLRGMAQALRMADEGIQEVDSHGRSVQR